MANPQKENGYTAIANSLMQALAKIRVNGEARQVFDFILYKTYGFRKKKDFIPHGQFIKGTGLRKQNINRAFKKLIQLNMIRKKDNLFEVNKDFDTWKPESKTITESKRITRVIQTDSPVIQTDYPYISSVDLSTVDTSTVEPPVIQTDYSKKTPKWAVILETCQIAGIGIAGLPYEFFRTLEPQYSIENVKQAAMKACSWLKANKGKEITYSLLMRCLSDFPKIGNRKSIAQIEKEFNALTK